MSVFISSSENTFSGSSRKLINLAERLNYGRDCVVVSIEDCGSSDPGAIPGPDPYISLGVF